MTHVVDEPVAERLSVNDGRRAVIKDVFAARVNGPAVTLLDALAVDGVGLAAARVVRRLLLRSRVPGYEGEGVSCLRFTATRRLADSSALAPRRRAASNHALAPRTWSW